MPLSSLLLHHCLSNPRQMRDTHVRIVHRRRNRFVSSQVSFKHICRATKKTKTKKKKRKYMPTLRCVYICVHTRTMKKEEKLFEFGAASSPLSLSLSLFCLTCLRLASICISCLDGRCREDSTGIQPRQVRALGTQGTLLPLIFTVPCYLGPSFDLVWPLTRSDLLQRG